MLAGSREKRRGSLFRYAKDGKNKKKARNN
jgi:hypothetical protein